MKKISLSTVRLTPLRQIASILIYKKLAFLSFNFREYEYLGDPLIILFILSNLSVDEVSIVDLDASKTGKLNKYLLQSMRSVADFPLSYAGGIRSTSHIDQIFAFGYDRIVLSCRNSNLIDLLTFINQKYGRQSVSVSIDYSEIGLERYIFDPYIRKPTTFTIQEALSYLPLHLIADIILTSVSRTVSGLDLKVFNILSKYDFSNPVVLSGGLASSPPEPLPELKHFSGIMSSTSMFLQSQCRGSALVSLPRFSY